MNPNNIEQKLEEASSDMERIFDDVAHNLASQLAEDPAGSLMPKSGTIQPQIRREMQASQTTLKRGCLAIFQALQEQVDGVEVDIAHDFMKLLELTSFACQKRSEFIENLDSGKTIQQIGGVSDATLEKMYQAAKKLYEEGRFQESADAFCFLTLLNSQKFAFWLGYANSQYQLQNFDAALEGYAFVTKLNPDDYVSHLFSSECYRALGDDINRKNALELALYVLGDDPAHREIRGQIVQQLGGSNG